MTDLKFIELAKIIATRTSEGAMTWEETGSEDAFQATLSKYIIRIKSSPSEQVPDEWDFEITILNSDGARLESFNDTDLTQLLKKSGDGNDPNGYVLMREIFKNAKRNALGVDKALDDILKELKELPPF
jgi:hypothetical protein